MKIAALSLLLLVTLLGCYTQVGYHYTHPHRSITLPDTAAIQDDDSYELEITTTGDTIQYRVVTRQEERPRDTVIIREKEREIWVWEQDPWGWWELRRYDDRSHLWRMHVSYRNYGYRGSYFPGAYYDPYWYAPRYRHRDTLVIIVDSNRTSSGSVRTYHQDAGGRSRATVAPRGGDTTPAERPSQRYEEENIRPRTNRHGRGR